MKLPFANIPEVRVTWLSHDGDSPVKIESTNSQSLVSFVTGHAAMLEAILAENGAVLLRGFSKENSNNFKEAVSALCKILIENYGDLPPSNIAGTYNATPYDPNDQIRFHNEASHTAITPGRQFFFCEQPAKKGGAWRVADGKRIVAQLPSAVVNQVRDKHLLYKRRFIPGVDTSWQQFFKTNDHLAAMDTAQASGYSVKWDDGKKILTTSRLAPGVINNGSTWFNQILLHHPYALEKRKYAAVERFFGHTGLPRDVCFGDATAISDQIIEEIQQAFEHESVTIDTQENDALLLNNLRYAHARAPYEGLRQVRVALGDPISVDTLMVT